MADPTNRPDQPGGITMTVGDPPGDGSVLDEPIVDLPGADVSEAVPPRRRDPDETPLLDVVGLRTYFHTRNGTVQAVDGVDLSVCRGEVLGVVGESGCGKSVTSLSVLGLVPYPGEITEGTVTFDGQELTAMGQKQLAKLRGDRISMIFQQPTSALNPVFRAGKQIEEVYQLHRDYPEDERATRAVEMLRRVGIPDPARRAEAYPHELSGGMAQRVMIAMALACEPDLLIADEPTTALDVTIQAQILDLVRDLVAESDTAVIMITHDLGVIAEMADRVAVMYAGQVVEEADVITLFEDPRHPYTQGLIGSMPVLGDIRDDLDTIPGVVPTLVDPGVGCRFAARCRSRIEYGLEECTRVDPELLPVAGGSVDQVVRCFLHHDVDGNPRELSPLEPGTVDAPTSADAGARGGDDEAVGRGDAIGRGDAVGRDDPTRDGGLS
ncbi:MAG TPA: ABC transporter ATP-binding protein [Nitriliruptoraceae bacterium]|nr:ABC transporter ATP-binding protein [Nitriliruptoraceae bacterium]